MSELPSGTVTFLFTDVEGSTRLWEQHPEAMRPALARHDEILRDAVAEHQGRVVKTTGDGIHAVFATAHDALDAAVLMQLGLGAESFGETGPLRVRMGVHTCEAEYREGDYFGSEVNRAARLMAIGHGGQVLCSQATAVVVVRDRSVRSWWIWVSTVCGICRSRYGCSRFATGICGPSFRRCGRWTR